MLPKIRLLSAGPLSLGAALPFTLPTGRQDAFLGAGAPSIAPTALAELRLDPIDLRLLANAGVALRGGRSLTNLTVGTAITYGLAAELPLNERLTALATLAGEAGFQGGDGVFGVDTASRVLVSARPTAERRSHVERPGSDCPA